ncbi:unnamed protein product [Rangifer tarandus platyrhynchus]|uniref:Uncharacterized protein n=2 Tax=Rangifer tarandus platyrhynchus TaxID=3082113 RepID=A0ACB0EUB0_RANTA|nr:unnamed protein product [Rangifer tarandus platyrhynchus]CAI9704158.1 unnamed protein product [Rangifer tarandus platyrhynchus]
MRPDGCGSDLRREARARERAPVWPRPSGRVPARPVPPAELGPRPRGRTITAPGPAGPPPCTSPAHLPGARTPAPPSPGASGLLGGRSPTGNSEASSEEKSTHHPPAPLEKPLLYAIFRDRLGKERKSQYFETIQFCCLTKVFVVG